MDVAGSPMRAWAAAYIHPSYGLDASSCHASCLHCIAVSMPPSTAICYCLLLLPQPNATATATATAHLCALVGITVVALPRELHGEVT